MVVLHQNVIEFNRNKEYIKLEGHGIENKGQYTHDSTQTHIQQFPLLYIRYRTGRTQSTGHMHPNKNRDL